tara:strand:- start:47 stop:334 length:288 start_codon:yes stop_codon:yes gene_type:complete
MAKKTWREEVIDILDQRGILHASMIKDILFDRVGTLCPSIRELSTMLKTDKRVEGLLAPAGVTQIKRWKLKSPQKSAGVKIIEKKLLKISREGKR